jgi:hypothetical protein
MHKTRGFLNPRRNFSSMLRIRQTQYGHCGFNDPLKNHAITISFNFLPLGASRKKILPKSPCMIFVFHTARFGLTQVKCFMQGPQSSTRREGMLSQRFNKLPALLKATNSTRVNRWKGRSKESKRYTRLAQYRAK